MARVRSLRKLAPGEKLPVMPRETFNTIIDLNTLLSRTRFNHRNTSQRSNPTETIVLIQNDTEDDVEQLAILGIDEPVLMPPEDENGPLPAIVLKCVSPRIGGSSEDDHRGRFVITMEPIAAGKMGKAKLMGVSWVRLNVLAETDEFADVADDNTTLLDTSTSGSAKILWKEEGSGSQWGLVQFPAAPAALFALVRIFGNRTGGGKYQARAMSNLSSTELAYAGNLTTGEIGSDDDGPEVTVLNANEIGKSTHALTASPVTCNTWIGFRLPCLDEDGMAVYLINGIDLKACT